MTISRKTGLFLLLGIAVLSAMGFGIFLIINQKSSNIPAGMVWIPAGKTESGESARGFLMDKSPVTVAEFSAFVRATNYRTEAQTFGNAGVFDAKTGEWGLVKNATYLQPFGPNQPGAAPNHPVTQVSWHDAVAYAAWANKRLPTYAEWVYASQNARPEAATQYAWGETLVQSGKYRANVWQGSFPRINTVDDGFFYTSPVGYFGETPLGLTDVGGNVWQWCADWADATQTQKLQYGGSYLCDPAVCHGFRVGKTASATPETSVCHVGFRCVR